MICLFVGIPGVWVGGIHRVWVGGIPRVWWVEFMLVVELVHGPLINILTPDSHSVHI